MRIQRERKILIPSQSEERILKLASGTEDFIELGLDRVGTVAKSLGLLETNSKVISIAGTNGKGSVVFFAEQTYRR